MKNQSAVEETQSVIERQSVIHLSRQDARKIRSLLDRPPKPNKKLIRAVKVFEAASLA
jgi:uncharacterized protein (DUF1778 family)